MSNKNNNKKNTYVMVDMTKANRTAFRSYIICASLYAIAGIYLFAGSQKSNPIWESVFYYILLFLPIIVAAIDYKKNALAEDFRYNLFATAMLFYIYLLYLDKDFLYFIFAVWLIGTSIIYFDLQLSKNIGLLLAVVQIIATLYFYLKGGVSIEIRII